MALNVIVKQNNMVNSYTSNSNEILGALKALNAKYKDYLLGEGRWLNEGFESIVSIEENPADSRQENLILKKEIFMMLPVHIREEIAKFMVID